MACIYCAVQNEYVITVWVKSYIQSWNGFFVRICLFVCALYKSTFLNQSEPNLAHISPSTGRDCRVCMFRKWLILFYHFDLFRERVQNHGHNMAAGERHFSRNDISVILASVSVRSRLAYDTCPESSPTVLYPWLLQVLVSRQGNDVVADDTCLESSAIALYSWFLQVLFWRHGNDVVAGDTCAFLLENIVHYG
jgi:hypothetical protein